MNATLEIARKEFLQMVRTKRLVVMGAVLVGVLLLLTVVLPLFVMDAAGEDRLGTLADTAGELSMHNFVIAFFLSGVIILSGYFLLQLTPLLLTADAVTSEWNNRTIFLLLSKPVSRAQFVLGKFLGIGVPLAVLVGILLLLDYALVVALVPGMPTVEHVGALLLAVVILVLGVLAYAAVGLFASSLMRSSGGSLLLAVVLWIIVLPLLSNIDRIVAMFRFGFAGAMGGADQGIGWSRWLGPGTSMKTATEALIPEGNPGSPALALLALSIHTLLFVGLSLWLVRRRDFE